jgi:diguanylate cyclase
VSNSILDKPGKLTDDEWRVVRKHPQYSYEILKCIPGFEDLSEIAASHHEKLTAADTTGICVRSNYRCPRGF